MTPSLSDPQGEYEQFLYTVSHDLQEPLRMVTSFLQLLEKKAGDELDDDARKYLLLSVENAERMKKMINALVDLSRVNRDTELPETVNLAELVAELVNMYSSTRGIQIEIESTSTCSALLPPNQALQLMRVLLENALDNQAAGRPLNLRFNCLPAGGDRVTCQFEDNGTGMAEQFTDRVFDIFRQTKRNPERIGAGLAIAKAIVLRSGGTISLSAIQDQGCVVTFDLPAAKS